MKPHPRIRKTIKWGGAVKTVLLVVVWIGSGWCGEVNLDTSALRLSIYHGRLFIRSPNLIGFPRDWPPNVFIRGEAPGTFHMDWSMSNQGGEIAIPLWVPASLILAASVMSWRLDTIAHRRARVGLCPKCQYDRTGLAPGALCPECGAPSPSAPRVS